MTQIASTLSKYAKSCILARGVAALQATARPTSSYGGVAWGTPGEAWPYYEGEPLVLALCLRVDELPVIAKMTAPHLSGIALLNIFIHPQGHPDDEGATVIRAYSSLNGLQALYVSEDARGEFYKIEWQKSVDYPDRLTLEHQLDNASDDAFWQTYEAEIDTLEKSHPSHAGIKIGGWPIMIQVSGIPFLMDGDPDYILQLGGTEAYAFYDSGIGYMLKHNGAFIMDGWTTL